MMPLHVLVTGANGFVGRAICVQALARGMAVRGAVRSLCELPAGVERQVVDGLGEQSDWRAALAGVEVVVHAAARVHVMVDTAANPLAAFRQVNVRGTLNLARQAAVAGVRRFVFISSIGVNGAETSQHPFTPQDVAAPHSPYAVSKYEAELGLQALAAETGMEVVIIRPPLVYGPGAPGNFGSLMRWLKRGVPLPLGALDNRRSLLGLDNLVDFISVCITHPRAADQTFLVSDGQDVSTPDLIRSMAQALGYPARLLPMPVGLLYWGANLLGRGAMAQRLCGSLQVDISKTRQLLAWQPPLTLAQGLKRMMEGNPRETPI